MSYSYPFVQQPYPYQDQLNQLRSMPSMYQPPRQDASGINWVQGESGAKSWIVAPGSTVLLMDSETQRFYLKCADQSGLPSMRVFEYSEIGADKPAVQAQQACFVTSEEFMDFKKSIETKLQELSGQAESHLPRKKKGEENE